MSPINSIEAGMTEGGVNMDIGNAKSKQNFKDKVEF
jgi:hypothetical protein